jgi:CRP-like cAMP-binding protein
MKINMKEIMNIPLFSHFRKRPQRLSALLQMAEFLSYPEGGTIINEGDCDGGALFVIYEGSVLIVKRIDNQSMISKPLAILSQGEFFGEMSLVDDSPRSAAVIARTDTVVIRISRPAFQELVKTDTELSSALLTSVIYTVSNRLRKTNMELVVLYDTGKIISRSQGLREMCAAILHRLCSSLSIPHGFIIIYNELSGFYESFADFGTVKLEEYFIQWLISVLSEKMETFSLDDNSFAGYSGRAADWQWIKSGLCVSLGRIGAGHGAMFLADTKSGFLGDAERQLAEGVAFQASSAIENAKNREEEEIRQAYQKRRGR